MIKYAGSFCIDVDFLYIVEFIEKNDLEGIPSGVHTERCPEMRGKEVGKACSFAFFKPPQSGLVYLC